MPSPQFAADLRPLVSDICYAEGPIDAPVEALCEFLRFHGISESRVEGIMLAVNLREAFSAYADRQVRSLITSISTTWDEQYEEDSREAFEGLFGRKDLS